MSEKDRKDEPFDALLRHVVHTAPMPTPPANFARDVARRLDDLPEHAGAETWIVRIAVIVMVFVFAGFALPRLDAAIRQLLALLDGAPWPLLLTAGAIFAGMKLVELARPVAPFR